MASTKQQSRELTGRIETLCEESGVDAPGQAAACISVFTSIAANAGMPTDAIIDMVVSSIECARGYIDRNRGHG